MLGNVAGYVNPQRRKPEPASLFQYQTFTSVHGGIVGFRSFAH